MWNKPCSIIGRLNGLKDYRQGSDNLSAKTQEYLQASILVLILILEELFNLINKKNTE